MLATGIIGGIAECAPAGAAGIAVVPPMCIAVPLVVADGAAPVQADGTDNAPTEVARPIPAEMAGAPVPPILVEASVPVPEPRPTDFATPNSFAAVLTARAAVAVLPVVKSSDGMLIGVVAIRSGVLSSFSIDIADVEDDDDDEPVAEDATLSRPCGDARLCKASRLLRLIAGGAEPCHVRCGGRGHRRRAGTRPRPAGQSRDDRAVTGRRGGQLFGQRLPGCCGGQHRARSRAGVMRAELISGGNAPKSSTGVPP
jgi:hypothetical protein